MFNFSSVNIFLYVFVCIFLVPNVMSSQDDGSFGTDSIRKTFPEIEVEADKMVKEKYRFTSFSQYDERMINIIAGEDITKAISFSPGLYILDYGGMGGLKTVSMRGTNSQQSLILIEGMRLNSTQNGSADLSNLPMGLFTDISVMKGGISALEGGNAVGGAVNMKTDIKDDKKTRISLDHGSFGMFGGALEYSAGGDVFSYLFNINARKSDGDYTLNMTEYGKNKQVKRRNADIDAMNASLVFEQKHKNYNNKNILIASFSGRGIPGAVVQGDIENRSARLKEKEMMFISKHEINVTDILLFEASLFTKFDEMKYLDSTALSHKPEMNYFTKDLRLELNSSFLTDHFKFDVSIESGYSALNGDMLQPGMKNFADRSELAFSLMTQTYDLETNTGVLKGLAGIRLDLIEDLAPNYSPVIGGMFTASFLPMDIKLQLSENFRAPSFNEMYYLNYGNVDLKPERSRSMNIDIGVYPWHFLSLSLSGFLIQTEDQIIAIPESPMSWSAENMAMVESKGIELNAAGKYDPISYSFSYTLMETLDVSKESMTYGKQVIYVPNELISGYLSAERWNILLGISANYSSHRYSQADNSYNSMLRRYAIINVFSGYEFRAEHLSSNIRLECNNLFNEDYSIIKNYPMPGRSYALKLFFEIK